MLPRLAVPLIAALIVLAGCVEDAATTSTTDTTSPAATTSSSAAPATTVPVENATNTPPTANLTADVLNGTTPLLVNFTLTLADDDGDNLTWTLDADGNGTVDAEGSQANTSANFTYTVPGVFNATLNVTDGTDIVSVNLTVNVTAGGATPTVLAEYTGSGTITAYALTGEPNMAFQCPGFITGRDGVGCVFLEFTNGPHDGAPAIITTDAGAVRAAFWKQCSPTSTGTGFGTGVSGVQVAIPAGTGCVVLWSNAAADRGQTRTFTLQVFDFLPEAEA